MKRSEMKMRMRVLMIRWITFVSPVHFYVFDYPAKKIIIHLKFYAIREKKTETEMDIIYGGQFIKHINSSGFYHVSDKGLDDYTK